MPTRHFLAIHSSGDGGGGGSGGDQHERKGISWSSPGFSRSQ